MFVIGAGANYTRKPTKADILEIVDEYASPQIMNNDTCPECSVNFKELNTKLNEYFK